MPFTFVHPVFVLPFAKMTKKWVSVTGLVAGSMVPDFEYFLRAKAKGIYGHTLSGIFWFDLPLAILLVFLFHNLVRNPLICNLPLILKKHLVLYLAFDWNSHFKNYWFVVVVSILFGTATHFLSDAFTHHDGYFVQLFPVLQSKKQLAGLHVPVYKLLQHGFTPIGVFVLLAIIKLLPVKENVPDNLATKIKFWAITGCITLAFVAMSFLFWLDISTNAFGHIVVATISGGLLGLLIACIYIKKMQVQAKH